MAELYGREQHDVLTRMTGAGVSSGESGQRQKGVVVARADETAQEFSANTIRSFDLKSDIVRYFGGVSEMSVELEAALYNGADRRDLRAVAPEEISVTDEVIPTGSGTLQNAPIIANESDVVVTTSDDAGTPTDPADDTVTEYTVNFVYETLPTAPAGEENTVNINPNSGEFEGPTAEDYSVSYRYADWDTALQVAADVVTVGDKGGIYCTSEAGNVHTTLSEIADEAETSNPAIRHDYRLAFALAPATPNATGPNGEALIDTDGYSDSFDNDALFLAAGGRISEVGTAPTQGTFDAPLSTSTPGIPSTILGGMFGRMLGNSMTNSIYEDTVEGYGDIALAQSPTGWFTYDEAQSLRESNVIPMMDPRATSSNLPEIGGNTSTSTATDYPRDFHRLTIKDTVNLNFRSLAEAARSEILVTGPDGVINETEQFGLDIFRQLAARNIIVGEQQGAGAPGTASALERTQPAEDAGTPAAAADGGGQQAPYSVAVTQTDTDELTIEYQFTPVGVVKQVNNVGVISDQVAVSLPAGGAGGGVEA